MKLNSFAAMFAGMSALFGGESAAWVTTCLHQADEQRAQMEARERETGDRMDAGDDFWFASDDWRSQYRPYIVKDGVLQIPVKGVLLHNFPYAMGTWATGYDYIWRAYQRGMGDLNVKGIALIVHSPGGMVAGCFECTDRMTTLKGRKPVQAFVSEGAYSAAYALVSVADKIHVTRTGGVGSVGVVRLHVDWSKWNEQSGLAYTYVYKGSHKVDGNPDEPLSDEVKTRWLDQMELPYSIFVTTVAENRNLEEQAVRDTEALTYTAPEALSLGLVDSVGSFDDSLADFSASLNLSDEGDTHMAEITQAQFDQAVLAARTEGETAGKAAGIAEGASAEKARVNAILGSETAKTRQTAALAAALDTDMSAEQAEKFLAKLPEETPAASAPAEDSGAGKGKDRFDKAMGDTQNPQLGVIDADDNAAAGGDDDFDARLNASFGSKKPKKAA